MAQKAKLIAAIAAAAWMACPALAGAQTLPPRVDEWAEIMRNVARDEATVRECRAAQRVLASIPNVVICTNCCDLPPEKIREMNRVYQDAVRARDDLPPASR